jgi:Fic-DOC domain mobile mystery protein B
MGLDLDYIDGQTPLDEVEKEGLLVPTIATLGELDEYEQQNIEHAIQWTLGRSFNPKTVFTEAFVCMVHKRMYAEVWSWAGDFRQSNKNLGVNYWQIPSTLKQLLDDLNYWHDNNTFPPGEIALRFKHRLVSIYCFPNGNGRHSRLIADIIIDKIFKQLLYSWGAANLVQQGNQRTNYLNAIKAADAGDIEPLINFAKS